MSARLCSTLNPEGELYPTRAQAKAAMDRMVGKLTLEGYKRLSTDFTESVPYRVVMRHPSRQSVSVYIRPLDASRA
jgi:hypothetical protein